MGQYRSRRFPGHYVRIVRMLAAGAFITYLYIPDYLQSGRDVLQRFPDDLLANGFQLAAALYAVGFFFRNVQDDFFFR